MMSPDHDSLRSLPIRSLQVFEAAARHGSFTKGGEELGITQSAVSRQVADLEARLKVRLFARTGPSIALTRAGRVLFERTSRALSELRAGLAECLAEGGATNIVTVSMLPSVAALWLAPRLESFAKAHREVDLRISASRHLVAFASEGIDLAIRYGRGNWPGDRTEFLCSETVFPVCTPEYAARNGIQTPADLLRVTLIRSDIEETWSAWFGAAGLRDVSEPAGPRISDDMAGLNAVLSHQAVTLGRSVLIADHLADGRLVAPFGSVLQAQFSYWMVCPGNAAGNPALASVMDWIRGAFRDVGAGPGGPGAAV